MTTSHFEYNALLQEPYLFATYFTLTCTFVTCYITKNHFLRGIVFFLAVLLALYSGVINWIGLLWVVILGVSFYFGCRLQNKYWRGAGFLIAFVLSMAILFIRPIPGIENWLIFKMPISPEALSYSMWFTFDKSLIGLYFIAFSIYSLANQGKWRPTLQDGLAIGLIATWVLIPFSFFLGYVKFEFKLPNFLPLWVINNLLFVCIAEEAVFRGMIQKFLMLRFQYFRGGRWAAVLIAAALFGLAHYRGGMNYMLLATVAGCFYGYAFMRTNKIEGSIIAHFTVNFIHFVGFTYPALKTWH